LGGRVRLARSADVVAFTTSAAGTELLERIVRIMAGTDDASLGTYATFRAEVRRLPADAQGLIYFGRSPAAEIRAATPSGMAPIGGAAIRRGVVGLYAHDDGIHAELRGLLATPLPTPTAGTLLPEALAKLPADTLAAFAVPVDYRAEIERIRTGRYPQLVVYFTLLDAIAGQRTLDDRLIDALGTQTVFVIGQSRRRPDAPQLYITPMAALMIDVNDPAPVAEMVHRSAVGLVSLLNTQRAGPGGLENLRVTTAEHGPHTVYHVGLGSFFKPFTKCVYAHTLELAWTIADGRLIVSTHREHVTQLLDAHRAGVDGQGGLLLPMVERASSGASASSQFIVQSAAAAAVVQSWIDYVNREYPDMTQPEWWQRTVLKKGEDRLALGIGVAPISAHPGCLRVSKVQPGRPGAGRLEVGDRIVGIDGRLLSTEDPQADFATILRARQPRKPVVLRIERADRSMDVTIPTTPQAAMPGTFDPVRLLRGLTALAKQFDTGAYTTFRDEPDRLNARLTLTPARAKTVSSP
jgi:hypothetical protein